MIVRIAVSLAAFFAVLDTPARAQEAPPVTYTVAQGDTLYGIAQRYLVNEQSAWRLRDINRVRNPRAIPIGTRLTIPRELLRFVDVTLNVAAFSGPVDIAGAPPQVGSTLQEGQVITTGANGFVTFRGSFGGRISVPSNSRARLIRARRYVLGESLDVDFAVESGRGSASSPTLDDDDALRMRTPGAVTAVRGTGFRVAFDPQSERSITEVVEGEVAFAAGEEEIAASAGFGVAATPAGLAELEPLLPAPDLVEPGAIQTDEQIVFELRPETSAARHRFQVARDAGFLDIISEQIIEGSEAAFDPLGNGRYFVRARAISESGIEGLSEAYSFRRKRLGVAADAGASDLIEGFVFQWLPEGGDNVTFAFQLWPGEDRSTMLIDETGLETTAVVLTDLAAGVYQWRVAVIEAEEEGLLKVWGPTQRLTVSDE
ncbi:MAG: LysM peptidoglycan-binding domain-containing protein [Pseudomonadota bacterium]